MPNPANRIWFFAVVLCGGLAQAEAPLPVQVVTARMTQAQSEYVLAGTLEAKDSVPIAFRDGGRLVSVAVRFWDSVSVPVSVVSGVP